METQRLATTRLVDLHALAIGGQPVNLAWAQIERAVHATLSPAHALLFAEPSQDASAGTVDWYGPDGPSPRRLTALDAAARSTTESRLGTLIADVKAHAESLLAAAAEGDRLLGAILLAAIEVPGPEHVWLVGEQPVLTAWGNLSRAGDAPRGVLLRYVRGAAVPLASVPVTAVAPAAERGDWWKTLAALAAILLLAVLAGWGLWRWFGLPSPLCRVEAQADSALDQEKAREAALRQQLAALRAGKAQQCAAAAGGLGGGGSSSANQPRDTPNPNNPPPDKDPPPPSPDDDRKRVQNQGGQEGAQQVTLGWDDTNDLDLIVECPDGRIVSFLPSERSNCGGALDVDANKDDAGVRRDPVENIVWVGDTPPGKYKVFIRFHRQRAGAKTAYRVTIRQKGQPERKVTGTIGAAESRKLVAEFTVPG